MEQANSTGNVDCRASIRHEIAPTRPSRGRCLQVALNAADVVKSTLTEIGSLTVANLKTILRELRQSTTGYTQHLIAALWRYLERQRHQRGQNESSSRSERGFHPRGLGIEMVLVMKSSRVLCS